jgi:hypothetical protein
MSEAKQTAFEKGNALETAVAAIERSILSVLPLASDKTFTVESKKIVSVGGVHHEIDIFVTIDLGRGYKSIFIFECKNWTDAVGKNDIIIFSKKIDVVGAQHGCFVAKSFTADAKAQARQDQRISLLIATEHDAPTTPTPLAFHAIMQELKHIDVHFDMRGSTGAITKKINPATAKSVYRGNAIDLQQYVKKWAEDEAGIKTSTFRSHDKPDGVYDLSFDAKREFEPEDFILDGMDIREARISVMLDVRVVHPPVVSHFEIESQGRYLGLAPVTIPSGGEIIMGLVSVDSQGPHKP